MNTNIEQEQEKTPMPECKPRPVETTEEAADRRVRERVKPWKLVTATAVVLAVLFTLGVVPRWFSARALAEKASAVGHRIAITMTAKKVTAPVEIELPSMTEAVQDTPIYARASGYLKKFNVDIGAKVEAGQVLAEIETPELDQQLKQAQAALSQTKANLAIATSSLTRWQGLVKNRAVSQQEADERKSTFDARSADVEAAEANVQRLARLQSFKQVIAPYAGIITMRNVDNGALVTGENNDAARMLFRLAQTDTLRVYINVPQNYFRLVKTGAAADVTVREIPGRAFTGKVVRTAGALDPATRTLKTEIQIPNADGDLLPGLFTTVKLSVADTAPAVVVPARAVIIQDKGPHIATVDAKGVISIQPITLGRDFGKTMEVLTGVEENAQVVTNPSDTLKDGEIVEIQPAEVPAVAQK